MSNKRFTETNSYTYSKLCDQFEKFKIPAFQRAYAWKPKQINDLWEGIVSNDKEYFITQYFAARDSVNCLKKEFGDQIKVDLLVKNIDGSD